MLALNQVNFNLVMSNFLLEELIDLLADLLKRPNNKFAIVLLDEPLFIGLGVFGLL